jgi:hypothetical protein
MEPATKPNGNLGVCLALMERPLKVLLIDLDFQATLSNMSAEAGTLLMASQSGNTSSRLRTGRHQVRQCRAGQGVATDWQKRLKNLPPGCRQLGHVWTLCPLR